MNKRGISGVIVTVLLILIAIAAVLLIYNLLKGAIKEDGEIAAAKSEIISFDAEIDRVDLSQSFMNITINREMGELTVKNVTIIKHTPIKADIISVVDLSGSMADCGQNSTCRSITDKTSCESSSCNWTEKFTQLKNANINFVNKILSADNSMGLVAYDGQLQPGYSADLTTTATDLNSKINTWEIGSGTCICCGINEAKTRLLASNSGRQKVIILMTDGGASDDCYEGDPRLEAIEAAKEAHEANITVHTIGFGDLDANLSDDPPWNDTEDLINISKEGGGNFYYAYNNNLADAYTKAYTDIFTEYGQEEYDHLKIMMYNSTSSCEFRINPPLPLETKTYQIALCVSNLERIEIYYVMVISTGKEIIGPRVDSWKVS